MTIHLKNTKKGNFGLTSKPHHHVNITREKMFLKL